MLYVGLISDESGAEVTKKKKKTIACRYKRTICLRATIVKKKKKKNTQHTKKDSKQETETPIRFISTHAINN